MIRPLGFALLLALSPAAALASNLEVQPVTDGVWAIVGETAQRSAENLGNNATFGLIEVNLAREPDHPTALSAARDAVGEGTLVLVGLERIGDRAQDDLLAILSGAFAGRIVASCGPVADRLRGDLLAALSGLTIAVPPLRDRPEDAVWLARDILSRRTKVQSEEMPRVSALAETALRAHDWPDNGRELRSRVMQALQTARDGVIQPADLFPERRLTGPFPTLAESRDAAERDQVLAALERTDGQVGEAARALNVSRTTLWEKMQKLGL